MLRIYMVQLHGKNLFVELEDESAEIEGFFTTECVLSGNESEAILAAKKRVLNRKRMKDLLIRRSKNRSEFDLVVESVCSGTILDLIRRPKGFSFYAVSKKPENEGKA